MGQRRTPRPTSQGGRRTRLLDPGVHETIVNAIKLGVPIAIACAGAGVAEQSYRNWLARGLAEHEARSNHDNPDPEAPPSQHDEDEQPYVDFYLAIIAARSEAATRNMGLIQKVATGGIVTEKTVRKYRDHDGNLVEEETVKRTAPDWRAAAWYLERSHRSEFGKDAAQVELTGPGGGAIQVELTDAEKLAEKVAASLQNGAVSIPALEAGSNDAGADEEAVDADVVEEAEPA